VLSDGDKRSQYDRFGHAGLSGNGRGFGGHGMNMEDIFSQFGDIFGDDIFGSFLAAEAGNRVAVAVEFAVPIFASRSN
jgi:molecular chaperone DnaJ